MNKDKIIKDLKERNDKLTNQRRQFEFNYYYEQDKVEKKDKEIKKLNEQIIIMEKYFEMICNLGYDYDGLNQVNSLKGLIDELVRYATLGRVCNTTEPMYIDREGKKYNILNKELKGSDK